MDQPTAPTSEQATPAGAPAPAAARSKPKREPSLVEQVTEHGQLRDPRDERQHTRYLRRALVLLLMVVAATLAVNWYVDPTGVTGRDTRWRLVDNAEVRSQKVDLYEALDAQPEVVLLGSSRTMKFEPSVVEDLSGHRAFNAAVSGGVPRDVLLFTRMLAAEQPGDAFPHLVWGLDFDAFRNKELRDGLSTDPRLRRYVPARERFFESIARVGTLLEWQTTKSTLRALRHGPKGSDGADTERPRRRFSPDGFQLWSLRTPRDAAELKAAVDRQIGNYVGYIFERDAYDEIEDEPREEFEQVLRIANENGDVPTLFLGPWQPHAKQVLAEHGMPEREREVREYLRELQEAGRLRFKLVDLTDLDSFDGDPQGFYDGVHMTVENTRRMLGALHDAGAL